jgi:signal transduction histidine kinase
MPPTTPLRLPHRAWSPGHVAKARLRLPHRTVRLRLTMAYGGLFLVSGAALLTITYLLVQHATGDVLAYHGHGGFTGMMVGPMRGLANPPPKTQVNQLPGAENSGMPDPAQVRALAIAQHRTVMHQLLAQSGIALAIMAVISIALGWLVAGRILRPLRTISAAARDISATNLHRRLDLDGPGDELKELGDTFDQLLARLEAAFHAQRQFVANASHELRTPLARQRTLAQVALADPDATAESLRAAHERVLVAGAQQERLIEALLALSRGQTGLDVTEPFDLAHLADQVLTGRRAETRHRCLTIRPVLAPAPATGSPRLAERLVGNLVENALRHNTDHGEVDIVTGMREGRAVISVTNTGPVVPEAVIDRLFQPFQRGTARVGHGEGLGLSIVQAIATAHGATISTAPRHRGGLVITVAFPAPAQPRQSL